MKALIGALAASIAFCAQAQQTVFMPIVIEVSGAGAVSGTNFRDGALMAIDEINAKGGMLEAQDQCAGERHADQPGRLARPGAEGDRRRSLRASSARCSPAR